MKFKLLTLTLAFGALIAASNAYATCGTALGTDYTIASSTNTTCAPSAGTTSVTINQGVALSGTIGPPSYAGFYISSIIDVGVLTNSGTISGPDANTAVYIGNFGGGSLGTLNNNVGGVISGISSIDSYGIIIDYPANSIGVINNRGTISGGASAIDNYGSITTINNWGTFSQVRLVTSYGGAISNNGSIDSIVNNSSGVISGVLGGIQNNALYNGTGYYPNANIGTITNWGSIIATSGAGLWNGGTIGTLNNAQGAGNTNGALTYSGALPTNYNIIVTNTGAFGKLAATSVTGNTTFGISALSARGSAVVGNYASIITGITNAKLGITGTSLMGASSNGYTYNLVETGAGTDIWNLSILSAPAPIPTGPSTENTQASMQNTAQVLKGTYTLQNSVLANSFTYDCSLFDKNNVCVSAGGRNTAVSAVNGLNNTSALLIGAYRLNPNLRIGAYADQNLSVNNSGSTVNLGNSTPLFGLFGVWSERLDGTGTEVKVSAAYGQKNTTVTRSTVGAGSTASEAGSGSSNLNSQGAQVIAKYGFGVAENVIVSPYVGIRYTQNNMGGYTEASSASVTAPLTYSALNTNATTALAGVGAAYRVVPEAMLFASAGVETDTNTNNGTYSATGVNGLTPVNFNANPVRTRPTAMLGGYYDVTKNQRLGVTGIYRQEPFQSVSTTAVMATYTVGL